MKKKDVTHISQSIELSPVFSPQIEGRIPNAPRELDTTAQGYWRQYTKALQAADMLFETDLETLADLCFWESLKVRARDELPKKSLFLEYTDPDTGRITHTQAHASFSNLKTIQQQVMKLREKLGLTVSDRSGLKVAKRSTEKESGDNDRTSIRARKNF